MDAGGVHLAHWIGHDERLVWIEAEASLDLREILVTQR
jgi:hypothetical protein